MWQFLLAESECFQAVNWSSVYHTYNNSCQRILAINYKERVIHDSTSPLGGVWIQEAEAYYNKNTLYRQTYTCILATSQTHSHSQTRKEHNGLNEKQQNIHRIERGVCAIEAKQSKQRQENHDMNTKRKKIKNVQENV